MLLASSIIASAQCTKPVIFDTDWWTDVDDACAVRILLDAERKGDVCAMKDAPKCLWA